jgi:fatty-acyl-CoA synthase
LSRLAITWLHPLGSLDDQLFQLEDSDAELLIVDATAFSDRGGDLAARASGLKSVLTLGPAGYGTDLLRTVDAAGTATARNLAGADDLAILSYTGGTTGKSKGALRYHREYSGIANAILADFEIPETPSYLAVAPISHVAGTKVLPTLLRGGTVHMLKGFDPEAILTTIERERINFTLFVPTMIYVLLDHPALQRTDLSFAGAGALRRLRNVAKPAGGGDRPDWPGVLADVRPDRMLSDFGAAQVRPRSGHARTVPVLRFPDRRLPGQDIGH